MTDAINNDYNQGSTVNVVYLPPNAPLDFDTLTKIAINLTPQSSPPSSPQEDWVYFDDGTNTESGNRGLRYYNGTSWYPIGYTLSQDTTPQLGGNLNAGGNSIKDVLSVLNSAQSSPPSTPSNGDFYMDDGTNTDDGFAGLRQYTNGAWEDVGAGGGGGSPREITASSPLVVLGDLETLALWRGTAPAGATLSINAGSLTDDTGALPAGCEIRLNNITDAVQTTLIASTYTEIPSNNDIAVGGDDIIIEIYNASGSKQNLTGNCNARLD